jgi:hypothetical protein
MACNCLKPNSKTPLRFVKTFVETCFDCTLFCLSLGQGWTDCSVFALLILVCVIKRCTKSTQVVIAIVKSFVTALCLVAIELHQDTQLALAAAAATKLMMFC